LAKKPYTKIFATLSPAIVLREVVVLNLLIFVNKFIDSFAYNQNISAKSIKTGFLFPVQIGDDQQPMRT